MKIIRIFVLFIAAFSQVPAGSYNAQQMADQFSRYANAPVNLQLMKHAVVESTLYQIAGKNPRIVLKEVGRSVEGRSINMLSFGNGKTRLLLWSQMHGDEPTATAALLAIFNFLAQNDGMPFVEDLYRDLNINAIVMLNPDGAELFQRRNIQDIDINRDARLLQSPEGQTLKRVREQIDPHFGYNLHNMDGREQVGRTRKLLNIAFMAPPFNYEDEDTASRIRAKKLIVRMKEILDQFIPGHMSRYDADFMPRAFGDAMQNWGVSTVLIESALHDDSDPHFLVKMNFIALLGSFAAIQTGDVDGADADLYDQIPLEGVALFDLLIRDISIYNGAGIPPFRGDIGINLNAGDSRPARGVISDIGDLTVITGGRRELSGEGFTVMPGLTAVTDSGSGEELIRAGVTSVFTPENKEETGLRIPPKSFLLDALEIRKHCTALDETGNIIRRGRTADLVIFKDTGDGMFRTENIIYVIRNGKIEYKKP